MSLWTIFAIPLTCIDIARKLFPQRKILDGKLVLIISNGSELNRHLAIKFADFGCDIAFVDFNEEFGVRVAQEVNEKKKTLAKAYKFDISNVDDIIRLRAAVKTDFGNVDILINNSEIIESKQIDKMIQMNVYGSIMVVEKFLDKMKSCNSGGQIVTISSISGLFPSQSAVVYSSTKSSMISYMIGLTERLRTHELQHKIKTTNICIPSASFDKRSSFLNINPEEIAVKVADAVIEEANFITIPNYLGTLIRLFGFLPLSVQQLARELFLRESL